MDNHKIVKEARMVHFTLTGGIEIEGQVFLDFCEPKRLGQQRVGELLNSDVTFLPLHKPGDSIVLINVKQIQCARLPSSGEVDELTYMGKKYSILVNTVEGRVLDVDLYVSLPQTSRRVKDYFDDTRKFYQFFHGEEVLYIPPRNILYVRD